MKNIFLVKNNYVTNLFVSQNCDSTIATAAKEAASFIGTISGKTPRVIEFTSVMKDVGVYLGLFSDVPNLINKRIECYKKELEGTDGFAILRYKDNIYVLSHSSNGVYYGIHDFLEKNASIVWGRGAEEYSEDYIFQNQIKITCCNYAEYSPFTLRVWNACGVGSLGIDHSDFGSALYFAKNKSNGLFHRAEDFYSDHALKGVGIISLANNIDDLAVEHPEYFMVDADGKPKLNPNGESFINYYNLDSARIIAERFVTNLVNDNLYSIIMPDSPYFRMVEGDKFLHEKEFVTDDGKVVYPNEHSYKSTVYFNYMNKVVREINRLRPNTYVLTFAYLYSELAPIVDIDEHLIVAVAPIHTNERYSYTDSLCVENQDIAQNISNWAKKCKKLCIYTYWNSFKGTGYTRPNLKQIQDNLIWFKNIGIYGLIVEGKLDCSISKAISQKQINTNKFYDLNEACTWVIQKLIWNPYLDIDKLLEKYAIIVYKEVWKEFVHYYKLLEKGFLSQNAYVWYPTGGDIYILQFIIGAGLDKDVLDVLTKAKEKVKSSSVKNRINSIYETINNEIKKYKNFEKEEGTIQFTEMAEKDIISNYSMDYRNNKDSIWNRAIPMKVLRDYNTFEKYEETADFECRMVYNGENIYIGYSIKDDLIKDFYTSDGSISVIKEDGSKLICYAETYIGGNVLNQSTYYGCISGFRELNNLSFYINKGKPEKIEESKGVKDFFFVKTSEIPNERYCFHVQKIPLSALDVSSEDFTPYGSFVYYSDRYGRAGWMGFGLWSKQNFQSFKIIKNNGGTDGKDEKDCKTK